MAKLSIPPSAFAIVAVRRTPRANRRNLPGCEGCALLTFARSGGGIFTIASTLPQTNCQTVILLPAGLGRDLKTGIFGRTGVKENQPYQPVEKVATTPRGGRGTPRNLDQRHRRRAFQRTDIPISWQVGVAIPPLIYVASERSSSPDASSSLPRILTFASSTTQRCRDSGSVCNSPTTRFTTLTT